MKGGSFSSLPLSNYPFNVSDDQSTIKARLETTAYGSLLGCSFIFSRDFVACHL
jgi:hypothetical protein